MRTSSWATGTPLDHLHRIGAVVFGLGLAGFGLLGLAAQPEMFSTTGRTVLGLSSNGLLAIISIAVGAVLVGAGLRGGRAASTILVIAGSAFVLSGLVNAVLLDTRLNLLAFEISNVVFSFVAGALLLFLGAWGRYAGHLPDDNPYRHERHDADVSAPLPTTFPDPADAVAARELADAERAVAQHTASSKVAARVADVDRLRREEDRVRRWRGQDV
jgi:Domain of unknown function (DUF4383)